MCVCVRERERERERERRREEEKPKSSPLFFFSTSTRTKTLSLSFSRHYPETFQVTPNLYGNLVSNIVAGLTGGPGVMPGCNVGEGTAIFEQGARHGTERKSFFLLHFFDMFFFTFSCSFSDREIRSSTHPASFFLLLNQKPNQSPPTSPGAASPTPPRPC